MRPARLALGLALALPAAVTAAPRAAHAFCGFYVAGSDARLLNRATTVSLMREGTRTVLAMRNHYEGPPEDFAMVVPVPVVIQRDAVKTLSDAVFDRLERLTSPRLVEYWEQDPCATGIGDAYGFGGLGAIGTGWGGGGTGEGTIGLGVRVEARFEVGEYDIVVLSAQDSSGLETWLRQQRYNIPAGAAEVLAPYVRSGTKFFVARVNVRRVRFENGRARLSPIRFHYDSDAFALPIRLGLLNSPGAQELVVHVIARDQRYEVANRPNVTIPTNLDVTDNVRDRFAEFYNALFDATLARAPNAVVTEYAWASSSCDPCPTPPLDDSDLATLGTDVLPSTEGRVPGAPRVGSQPSRTPSPVVRPAAPRVTGAALSPEVVRRVVRRNLPQVEYCYAQGLAIDPSLAGAITLRFVVGAEGVVMSAAVQSTTLRAPSVGDCIVRAARRWTFPAPQGGAAVPVDYPFVLSGGAPSAGTVANVGSAGTIGLGTFGGRSAFQNFVVTRLHLRYGRETADDLVFRVAPPIVGGRELPGPNDRLEQGSRPDATNNFQARYAIRHAWEGPVACDNPRRGVWGEPPRRLGGTYPDAGARPATNLAFAGRAADLAAMLRQPLALPDGDGGVAVAVADAGAAAARRGDAAARAADAGRRGAGNAAQRGGCGGCDARGAGGSAGAWGLTAAAGVLAARRRKRAR